MTDEEEIANEFNYGDQFKEDLIHQLWHLVHEIQKLNENLEKSTDKIEYLGEMVDGLGTEIYKYRKDQDLNSDKPTNKIWVD
jgi:cell division septum initiation protein DivIVA